MKNDETVTSPLDHPSPDGLTPMELRVVEALVNKSPKENRTELSSRLGISRRTFYDYEHDPKIQDAVQEMAANQFKIAYAGVLAAISRKASAGNVSASKIFLEEYARLCHMENKLKRDLERQHQAFMKSIGKESIEAQERIIHEYKNNLLSS